ncbi:MAG: hypothetical protein ACRD2L_03540, partial [Terriglobia bacterium]
YTVSSLHPEEIDSLYLGCRMKGDARDKLLTLLNDKLGHVKVFQGSPNKTRFCLDFTQVR